LVGFMTSGPVIKLELERPNGIKAWRALLGPTNPTVAKEQSPGSIRAQFGNSEDPEVSTQVRSHAHTAALQPCSNAAMQPCSNAAMQQCSNAAMQQACLAPPPPVLPLDDRNRCVMPFAESDSRSLSVGVTVMRLLCPAVAVSCRMRRTVATARPLPHVRSRLCSAPLPSRLRRRRSKS
jgi:hypothetical protein